jgi:lambda family phage portal protein
MGVLDRIKLAAGALVGGITASWGASSGYRTKTGSVFNGSKMSGNKLYKSAFDLDSGALRDACRAAYWDSSQARAIISRFVDSVIGAGVYLEYQPEWDIIGATVPEDQRDQFTRMVEKRFHLWARSKEADAAGGMSLYELQAFQFLNWLRDGETVHIMRYVSDPRRMNPLTIQTIDPHQVQTPYDKISLSIIKSIGARIEDGIEVDANGREVAIHVQDPDDFTFTRVPVFGSQSGRRFVLHPKVNDTINAVRGTSILGPVIHELKKIADYSVAELEAAVINAVLAVWIKPSDKANASAALTGVRARGNTNTAPTVDRTERQAEFDRGGLIVQSLKAGEEIVSFDSKRPNVNFEAFVKAVTKHISASVGMPIEVLEMSFNANYSASRASLLLFWTAVERWRAVAASQFLDEVFYGWFSEEVKKGNISAPGFGGASAYVNAAWLNCSWMGQGKPSIDPLKEANAVEKRLEMGHTTGEREAIQYNNSDFTENVRRRGSELDLMRDNGMITEMVAPDMTPPAEDYDDDTA